MTSSKSTTGKHLVRVSARSDAGFHRAGQFWPGAGRVTYVDDATLARLKAEKQLVVEDAELGKLTDAEKAALEDPNAVRGPQSEEEQEALRKSADFPLRRDPQRSHANVQHAQTTDAHGNSTRVAVGGAAGATPKALPDAGEKSPTDEDEPDAQSVVGNAALTQDHKKKK